MSWSIERDADGRPMRLWWALDRPPLDLRPLVTLCPRCRSARWRDGRCLDCWCHGDDANWRPGRAVSPE